MIVELQENPVKNLELTKSEQTFSNTKMVYGWKLKWIRFRIKLTILKVVIRSYRNPIDWLKALYYLEKLRRQFLGNKRVKKMAYANGEYHLGLYTPGWNSKHYEKFIASQVNDFKQVELGLVNRFNDVFFAITKKCPLQCEHCFEWDNLNKKETLDSGKLIEVVRKLQEQGVSQIHLSGGEPMLKVDDIIQMLSVAKDQTDFWLFTSGFKLNSDNARRLKTAGLKGVVISLDHHEPELHNSFRHYKEAYYWVEEAIKNSHENNLITALSLCTTKEFVTTENLNAYMDLAKTFNVAFVQFLEPKAVGHYANKDVSLGSEQIKILEDFFIKMNFSEEYLDYPSITYHGYYQRRQGCLSAGTKGIYIDTDGDINPCPFCHKKAGSILDSNIEENLKKLTANGCPSFSK